MGTKELDTCTCALLWYLLDDLRPRTSATWKEFGRPHLTTSGYIVFHVDRMVGRGMLLHASRGEKHRPATRGRNWKAMVVFHVDQIEGSRDEGRTGSMPPLPLATDTTSPTSNISSGNWMAIHDGRQWEGHTQPSPCCHSRFM